MRNILEEFRVDEHDAKPVSIVGFPEHQVRTAHGGPRCTCTYLLSCPLLQGQAQPLRLTAARGRKGMCPVAGL